VASLLSRIARVDPDSRSSSSPEPTARARVDDAALSAEALNAGDPFQALRFTPFKVVRRAL
jgi:hypothetical protein